MHLNRHIVSSIIKDIQFTAKIILFLALFFTLELFNARTPIKAKITCSEEIPLKLQAAIVTDRSMEFMSESKGYITIAKYLLLDLVDELQVLFRETNVALASFTNYKDLKMKGSSSSDRDSCYKFHLSMNSNTSLLETLETQVGDVGTSWKSVSALTAAANAATDPNINWKSKSDRSTMKIIVILTDKPTNDPLANPSFHANKGDFEGYQKDLLCNHKIPKHSRAGEIIRLNKMFVVGLFHSDNVDKWKEIMKQALPRRSTTLSFLDDTQLVLDDVKRYLQNMACQDFSDDFDEIMDHPGSRPTVKPLPPVSKPGVKPSNTFGPRFLPL